MLAELSESKAADSKRFLVHGQLCILNQNYGVIVKSFRPGLLLALLMCPMLSACAAPLSWSEERSAAWYHKQPWLVGCNYIPATAINQLEMWRKETFDPKEIDKELGWAESLGMNTVRVFLHDLLWQQDPIGFKQRIDKFLSIAQKHHIKTIFVLFDSVWDPSPKLGPQRQPRPGVHNSGWVQSPGAAALKDVKEYPRLQSYVGGVIGAFAKDSRVLAWDLWNEPNNNNQLSYIAQEPKNKTDLVVALLPRVFAWARAAGASQPLTCALWDTDLRPNTELTALQSIQLTNSDVISFHNYQGPAQFEKIVVALERYRRPIICTEYMARLTGSTFEAILPIAKKHNVGAINWGLVVGKTQTNLPWDSWRRPYIHEGPPVWFHEVFQADGTPYRQEEVELIRKLTGK